MKFITTIYGDNYVPMLWTHLQSIHRYHPNDIATIFYGDVTQFELELLKKAFPNYLFIKNDVSLKNMELLKRIPLKLQFWRKGFEMYPEEFICLLDCDTLLRRSLIDFENKEFDVFFTWKDEKYPLNTGVILLKNKKETKLFMKQWELRTKEIIRNPKLYKNAINGKFGTADQHSLAEILGTQDYKKPININFGDKQIIFKGVECRYLNETKCKPIKKETYVIHYKSSWHSILFKNQPFSIKRPEKQCREMFNYWQILYRLVNRRFIQEFSILSSLNYLEKFNLTIDKYEERGILNSEMLLMCSIVNNLDIDLIIESGRYKGQSTEILVKNFIDKEIISIELNKDEIAQYTEEKLRKYPNLRLLYGDSSILIPKLLNDNKGKRIAVLFDGPKGEQAINIFKNMIINYQNVIVGFFHDMKKSVKEKLNSGRILLENSFERVFFTDNEKYIDHFKDIDFICLPQGKEITNHDWRPWKAGNKSIGSYGPTLGVLIPVSRERILIKERKSVFTNLGFFFEKNLKKKFIKKKINYLFRIKNYLFYKMEKILNR